MQQIPGSKPGQFPEQGVFAPAKPTKVAESGTFGTEAGVVKWDAGLESLNSLSKYPAPHVAYGGPAGFETHQAATQACGPLAAHPLRPSARNEENAQHAGSRNGEEGGKRSMRRLPDHRDTRRLANALSTSNRVIEQQRQRVEDLKQRLAAAGIDVTAIEERVRGGPGRRKQASTPTPSGGNGGASDYQCPARLYPGHCKIPPPRSSSASPPPAASESRELPPPREMDPKVLARLYRPLHEFRPPEPVSHDITQRTAVIRHNGEPYRGDSVSKDKIPKVKLTEDTVKRCYDNEIVRRRAHLKQSADKVEADKRAEHLRVRSTIGMPKLALPATGGAPQPGFDRNGLPEFTKEKAERLHDQMCARFKAAHAAAAEKALAREREHRVHPDRKLTKEEMQMSALRLHDESVRRLKDTMLAAATKANAVNLKTATLYQSQGGSSAD